MLRVYTASKLKHAPKWRDLCAATPGIQAHARWLKHNVIGTPDSAENAAEFWLQDEQDVRDADVVMVYGEGDDKIRGALVEAGIAIACGIPVVVVGEHSDYGTWQFHPGVTRMPDLPSAIAFIRSIEPRYRRISRAA